MFKKCLLFLVLGVFAAVGVFAQASYGNNALETGGAFVSKSIGFGLEASPPVIRNEDVFSNMNLLNMPLVLSLYSSDDAIRAERIKWIALGLNLYCGFGIGSFVQGDTIGGNIGLWGDLAGCFFLVKGLISAINGSYATVELLYGSGLLIGTRIFQIVRPFVYAESFSVAVAPSIDANGKPAVTALARFEF